MHHPGFDAPKKKFKSNYLYGAVDEAGDVKESDISLIGSIQSNRGGVGEVGVSYGGGAGGLAHSKAIRMKCFQNEVPVQCLGPWRRFPL